MRLRLLQDIALQHSSTEPCTSHKEVIMYNNIVFTNNLSSTLSQAHLITQESSVCVHAPALTLAVSDSMYCLHLKTHKINWT
jgi:hypothetical protein